MSRVKPAAWGTLLNDANRAVHVRVWFAPPGEALVDLSDYLVPGMVYEESVNELVNAVTLLLDRSIGASSTSPLMTADPPVNLGYQFMYEEAITSLTAAPASDAWMEMFRGTVREIDFAANPIKVVIQDLAGTLQERYTDPGHTYASGSALEDTMQDVLDDVTPALGVTLDVPVSPAADLAANLEQSHESVLQAQRALAESIGWQARYWWHEVGEEFRFSLLEPPRDKTTPDWTTSSARYLSVPEARLSKSDIRNHVTVYYGPTLADGTQASVVEEDAASIAKYGLLAMVLREGTTSPIQTESQARALALAAISDLSEPDVTHSVVDFDLPHIQLWDLIRFTANNVHYNTDQDLAVQTIRREYPSPGVARITLGCRGKPSAGIGTWKRRAKVGQITEVLRPPDPTYGRLLNWRPIPASADNKLRFGFERGPGVASVWSVAMDFPAPWSTDFFATLKAGVQPIPDDQDWVEMDAASADRIESMRTEPRLAGGGIVEGDDVVKTIILDPVDPKINGWIDAKYDAGILKVFAGCNPTASALPVAYEIRTDSQAGTLLASGSFTSLAAAVAGVGGTGALTALTPPADGKKFYFAKFTDVAGNVQWVSDSVENPVKPRIRKITQLAGATSLTTGISVTIESPMGRDVSLKAWTNPGGMANPNLAGLPDETIATAFTAGTPGTHTHTPPATSLTEIPVWPGRGKVVGFEAVDELGLSTGVITFTLYSQLDLVGADGELITGAIKQPAQFASSMRPFRLVATQPASGTYSGDRVFALDTKLAWEWDGSAWDAVTIAVGGVSFLPIIIANSITAMEVAVGEIYARHLNVADVFLEGVGWTANSPGAGRIAWSTGTVVHNGNRYTLTAGNTPVGHTIVWWDQSSPTVFQTATDMDAVAAAGFSDVSGDRIIALNDGGTPLVVWNGTRIYGGHLTTDIVKAKHVDSITMRVGKYIESNNFVAGSAGWRLDDDVAEFNDVVVRGELQAAYGTFEGTVTIDTPANADAVLLKSSGANVGSLYSNTDMVILEGPGGINCRISLFESSGNDHITIAADDFIDLSAASVRVNSQALSFGSADSGGIGFRIVRVPN